MSENLIHLNSERVRNRRVKVFGLMILSTALATLKWTAVIPTDCELLTKFLMVLLFVLTFGWIALFFWSSVFGFIELLKKSRVPGIIWPGKGAGIHSRTAVLMPVYNESPVKTVANLLAMAEELEKTGHAGAFDIFILSDTTNPKVWVEEERIWLEARRLLPAEINLFYRRRPMNLARKSGNIEDFCNKWGAGYDFMIVLDADSLVCGETMVKMVQLMEANPQTGIIQAPPLCVNKHSLFARIQQFAGKVYGPVVASGLAYWQVGDSNYWGHNAIIRVKAFMDCCGLPVLKGRAPFGGHILSHDFVEAALIRRGGWAAWLLPELKGSYEECPPTMIDFAVRDRRWCQGNMPHMKVLVSKGLHPVSRVHFIIGIMSYLSSPLWLSFLLVGLAIALGREFFPPVYFPEARTLFPTWPVFDKIGTITLFGISMFMLFFPKFMGLIVYEIQNKSSKIGSRWGAFKSVWGEMIISVLTAPVMMMFQSKFVLDIFGGRSVNWNTQNRDDNATSFRQAWERHFWHTALGIAATVIVWLYARELFWWILPITTGLMLSIPVSMLTSYESLGRWCRKHNWFVIPEEINEPEIIRLARNYARKLAREKVSEQGATLVVRNGMMNALHLLMLPVNGPAPEISAKVLEAAQIKLESFINHGIVPDWSREEEIALLYSPEVLKRAHLALQLAA